MTIAVAEVSIYPVKSCRGLSLSHARVIWSGLEHDRSFMVVDGGGRFLSQRSHPRLCLASVALEADRLRITAPGRPDLEVPLNVDEGRRQVEVWRDTVAAVSAGPMAARWLTTFLDEDCELVRMPEATVREVDPDAAGPGHRVAFADAYPLLVVSEASLADLNRRLEEPLTMDRFRPNLVVTGCPPFAEDEWRRIRIGNVEFVGVKPCARCSTTTVDQMTAERGKEPLATLARYRRRGREVLFGQNMVHLGTGVIQVGDPVEVLETGPSPQLDG